MIRRRFTSHRAWFVRMAGELATMCLATSLWGCTALPPSILHVPEIRAVMNEPLSVDVAASDADSDTLSFSLRGAPRGATLSQVGGKLAKFQWTPNPAQLGVHTVTFVADDGDFIDTETVNVRVTGGGEPRLASPSRFVFEPDVTIAKCILEVADDDDATLDINLEPAPRTWAGDARIVGKRVYVSWKPTAAQKVDGQVVFTLHARDDEGHPLDVPITLALRGSEGSVCGPRKPPSVAVDPLPPQVGSADYPVHAVAADEQSAITSAVVQWTTIDDPLTADWQQAPLSRDPDGSWSGFIANLRLATGESARVRFRVCATDDDDMTGDTCDASGCTDDQFFAATASLSLCDVCDVGQCGDGVCVNARQGRFCSAPCGADAACPQGFTCARVPHPDGGTVPQCVPQGCSGSVRDLTCSCNEGTPVPPSPGDLVINEVLADPPDACTNGQSSCTAADKLTVDVNGDGSRRRDETDEEYIELVNRTAKPLQLADVTLSDSTKTRYRFGALVLPPGRAVLVFGGGDPARFAPLGGAFRVSAAEFGGLLLSNSAEHFTLARGPTVLDQVQWTSSPSKASLVRSVEGDPAAPFVSHASAAGSSGARFTPGTHVCGAPFPLDHLTCLARTCALENRDADPVNDTRAGAVCLRPLPRTQRGVLGPGDVRDLYVIEGAAGQWLHARTGAGAGEDIVDTVLRLQARTGEVLASNDDDPWTGGSYHARLVAQLPVDGAYFIELGRGGTASPGGAYSLTVDVLSTAPTGP